MRFSEDVPDWVNEMYQPAVTYLGPEYRPDLMPDPGSLSPAGGTTMGPEYRPDLLAPKALPGWVWPVAGGAVVAVLAWSLLGD